MRNHKRSGKTVVIVILVIVAIVFLLCVGIAAAIILPAVEQSRSAARHQQSMNNLKKIGRALHNYHDQWHAFPPALTQGAEGQPLGSWRALLLPYLAENYARDYDYNASWEDPNNQAVAQKYRDVFASPYVDKEGFTSYVAVVGPKTAIAPDKPLRMSAITDGTANTICIIEDVNQPVPWNAPQDIMPGQLLARYNQEDFPAPGFLALFADGSVRMVPLGQSQLLEILVDRADGQVTQLNLLK